MIKVSSLLFGGYNEGSNGLVILFPPSQSFYLHAYLIYTCITLAVDIYSLGNPDVKLFCYVAMVYGSKIEGGK